MQPRPGRFSQRAILIYSIAIVAPACVVLWLGIQSFERQHEALASLAAERLGAEEKRALQTAAEEALKSGHGPVARYFFRIERGVVTRPALQAAPRDAAPAGFADAERKEFSGSQLEAALDAYRELSNEHRHESLALSGVARCLAKLGRAEPAQAVWRKLASEFPDDRDLSHRPFGIVAAMEAGDTQGLYDRIESGRWELASDQAEYFLHELDPKRTTAYLDQFRFARELSAQFRPSGVTKPDEVESFRFGSYRVFYRDDGAGVVSGFAVNEDWVERTLRPQLERALGFADFGKRDLRIYGAAMAAVFLILSAGVALLWRDVSREARTNRIRSDLVSSVSHELKTPITLIRLYGETLLDRAELSAAERTDFFRIIVRESERLSRLVNQVLTFSRIERGAQSYSLEEGDLREAISGIVDDYREYLDRAGFTVERTLGSSAAAVRFDAAALSQAVTNLLDNAVKYSGLSREIGVRLEASSREVRFEVADHGVGVPVAEQTKIFERFYRASNVTGNGNGAGKAGYGLGLFLVRHIMEAHGGRAEVESAPGQGSRFRLVFPTVTSS
jgi:signal transduction histidine kinase